MEYQKPEALLIAEIAEGMALQRLFSARIELEAAEKNWEKTNSDWQAQMVEWEKLKRG